MRASYHITASAGVALAFQITTHSWPGSLGCFLSGFLIDVDHYLEYYIDCKEFPFHYQDLVDYCQYGKGSKESKVHLFFHAYEYLFVLWFSIYFFHLGNVWLGVTLGLTTHLICDQFTNPIKPLFYFLTFRTIHQFEKTKLLSEKYFQRKLNDIP